MNETEALRAARIVFTDCGGAVGTFRLPTGEVCAVGALYNVVHDNKISRAVKVNAQLALEDAAEQLFSLPVVGVNDILGRLAVLSTYDLAIKIAERWFGNEERSTCLVENLRPFLVG